MKYTEETLIIDKPSKKLLKAVEELRKHKLEQIERLRNMKPEEFSRRDQRDGSDDPQFMICLRETHPLSPLS